MGAGGNAPGFLLGIAVQAVHQRGHLLAGGAVDALHGGVTGARVAAGGKVGVAAFAVGLAELAVLIAQTRYLGLELRVVAGVLLQAAEHVLHGALLLLELAPVLVQVGRLLAAQQDVLPLLHLDLEGQVGLVDQLRGLQRAVEQALVGADAAGEEVEAGEGDQQHEQQAAAQQRKDLGTQGSVGGHRGYASKTQGGNRSVFASAGSPRL